MGWYFRGVVEYVVTSLGSETLSSLRELAVLLIVPFITAIAFILYTRSQNLTLPYHS